MGSGAVGMRRGVLGGADVRPVRGVCGRPGRRHYGGGLGGIVCLGGRGAPAGGVVGVPFADADDADGDSELAVGAARGRPWYLATHLAVEPRGALQPVTTPH